MAAKPELNEKLLNCVLEHIEHEVKNGTNRYNQNDWATIDWPLWSKWSKAASEGEDAEIDQTQCGTSGCVAGWACMLSTPLEEWSSNFSGTSGPYSYRYHGQRKLGLTEAEGAYLFDGTHARGSEAQLAIIKGRVRVIRESREKYRDVSEHPNFHTYKG